MHLPDLSLEHLFSESTRKRASTSEQRASTRASTRESTWESTEEHAEYFSESRDNTNFWKMSWICKKIHKILSIEHHVKAYRPHLGVARVN